MKKDIATPSSVEEQICVRSLQSVFDLLAKQQTPTIVPARTLLSFERTPTLEAVPVPTLPAPSSPDVYATERKTTRPSPGLYAFYAADRCR
jgi:hypothetical protein